MKKFSILLFIFTGVLFWLACEIDTGLEPTRSGFSGTVFFNNKLPENTDKVMVVAVRNFPPAGVTDLITGPALSISENSADYEFYTPPGTYEAVGVVWKEIDQAWSISNIIGIYFPTSDHFAPGKITVPASSLINSIDIQADFSYAAPASNSGIQGTLEVKGTWPPSATSVLVAASRIGLPKSLLDIEFGLPIKAGFESMPYSLSLPPGTYNLVGTLLVQSGKPVGLESVVSYYKSSPTNLLPSSVTVKSDTSWISQIDMTLVFN